MPFRPEKLTVKSQEALQRRSSSPRNAGISSCRRCICSNRCSMKPKGAFGRCWAKSASRPRAALVAASTANWTVAEGPAGRTVQVGLGSELLAVLNKAQDTRRPDAVTSYVSTEHLSARTDRRSMTRRETAAETQRRREKRRPQRPQNRSRRATRAPTRTPKTNIRLSKNTGTISSNWPAAGKSIRSSAATPKSAA